MNTANAECQYLPRDLVFRVGLARQVLRGRVSDVALIIVLLCISGDLAAMWVVGKETTYAVIAVLLACGLLLSRRLGGRAFRAFLPAGVVFVTLCIVHAYAFDFFPIVTVTGFLIRLFIGMAVVIIVSDFVRAYVLAMVGLASLSFLFWIPEYIALRAGIHFHEFFRTFASKLGSQPDDRWSLGFYTYVLNPLDMHRNSGIFWEPGAFAGYLIVALLMLAVLRPSLTRRQHLVALCILTLALISTFSTTGYVAFPIAFLLNFDWPGMNRKRKAHVIFGALILASLTVLSSLYAFNELDFLGAKIHKQIKDAQYHVPGYQINRIGNLEFDWKYVSRRPFTGWGVNKETRFALTPWAANDSFGNGMSDFIVKFGVIGFGTFLLGVGRGASRISGKSRGYVLAFVASILVVLQGEPFLGYPFFLGLMFLGHASVRSQRLPKLRLMRLDSPDPVRVRVRLQAREM